MTNKECEQILNEYIQFFNIYISDTIYKYFESDDIQQKIHSYDDNIKKKYLRQHFIKTYNLLIAIFILAYGNNVRQLPDEAKIVFRSLFENILNFIYIFSHNEAKEQIKLIKQFYNYTELAYSNYQRHLLKENDKDIINTKEHKIVMSLLQKLNIKDKLLNKEKEYKKNFSSSTGHWCGKTTKQLIDYIRKNKPEWGFDLYQKYYYDTNIFVHCNVLEYMDKDGNIVENRDELDILDLIHKSIFMFFGYAEGYFNMLGKSLKEHCPKAYEIYEPINEKYHELYKNQDMKDIYI